MNTSRSSVPLATAIGLALLAASASAQHLGIPSRGPLHRFQEEAAGPPAPTGGNGAIREITADQFEKIDTDDDNRISLFEFTRSPILEDGKGSATGQSATVAAPRTDGSVLVKPAPGRNTPELFRRLDKNRDRYLDPAEIAAFYLDEIER